MLSELRRKLDLTQAIVADRLDVTQENISQIERGEADVRLSTLSRYVEALGGHLEVRAAFPEETVALSVGTAATMRRRRTRRGSAATAEHQSENKENASSKRCLTRTEQACEKIPARARLKRCIASACSTAFRPPHRRHRQRPLPLDTRRGQRTRRRHAVRHRAPRTEVAHATALALADPQAPPPR